ncbi:transporter substrate-binding domain-containing protein [Pacificibacter marinus]|uniref:transporter substrate-binding domain-containing protein n=1 Tax=Pacificibacter marinus TaxID=658057 RepID=UPI001C073A4E|nr:transporter substrate-binding domain-containing protein [Pacificibacter marinus]MBU2865522.1 transporter substrate-binding domain-containing protein [Pacificibacter marinus]
MTKRQLLKSLPIYAAASVFALWGAGAANAACNVNYTVTDSDTLFQVAEREYGSAQAWTLIYYANQGKLNGTTLVPGSQIYIPCTADQTAADPTPLLDDNADLKFLTGSNYAPFTDRDLPGGGMVTEIVNAAMELAPSPVTYSVTWNDDWSQHLDPLLKEKDFDMGFPWGHGNCDAKPEEFRCQNFLYSDSLITVPIMLFVKNDNAFEFNTDEDLAGKSICRPDGYFTYDLEREGRDWLNNGVVTIVRAADANACMQKVMDGEADAASVNLFLGANLIVEMGLRDIILPLERPISEGGLHVVVSKTHWRATAHLYRVNEGLRALKADGRYHEIVGRHLEAFWAQLQ